MNNDKLVLFYFYDYDSLIKMDFIIYNIWCELVKEKLQADSDIWHDSFLSLNYIVY